MGKDNKHGVTLRSLRRSIKNLKKNDTDGTWSIKARALCCEAYMALPKKYMIRIAEEIPIDGVFMPELYRLIQTAGYTTIEKGGKESVFVRSTEEMCELIEAMTKSMREKEDLDNIKEEIADVENCIAWIKYAYNLETDPTISKLQYLKMYRELTRLGKVSDSERTQKMQYLIKDDDEE